jgi:hypothetical protein
VLPIAACFIGIRRREVAKGIIAGAAMAGLVNIGGCFIVVSAASPLFLFGAIAVIVFGSAALISSLLKE